jgi:membrane glycosyltransferase
MASRRHGWKTVLGILWAGGVYWLRPEYLWWLLPIVGALIVSIPLSVFTSRISLGRHARAAGIFAIPEESNPPVEIQRTHELFRNARALPGFADAVTDPVVNALACATSKLRQKNPTPAPAGMADAKHALGAGINSLSEQQKLALLNNTSALSQLGEHMSEERADDTVPVAAIGLPPHAAHAPRPSAPL